MRVNDRNGGPVSPTRGGNVRRTKGVHTFPPNQNQHPFPHLQQSIDLLLLRIAPLLTPSAPAAPDSSTSQPNSDDTTS